MNQQFFASACTITFSNGCIGFCTT